MKLVKFVPAVAATLVLAACSTSKEMAKEPVMQPETVEKTVTVQTPDVNMSATASKEVMATQSKSVVYKCNSGQVVVSYAFHDGQPKGANLRLGKSNEIKGFLVDAELTQKVDSPVFTSGDYVLSTAQGLSFDTAIKTDLVMVYKKGQLADEILAKNCKINKSATKKLNK